jgi:hypothetical protein
LKLRTQIQRHISIYNYSDVSRWICHQHHRCRTLAGLGAGGHFEPGISHATPVRHALADSPRGADSSIEDRLPRAGRSVRCCFNSGQIAASRQVKSWARSSRPMAPVCRSNDGRVCGTVPGLWGCHRYNGRCPLPVGGRHALSRLRYGVSDSGLGECHSDRRRSSVRPSSVLCEIAAPTSIRIRETPAKAAINLDRAIAEKLTGAWLPCQESSALQWPAQSNYRLKTELRRHHFPAGGILRLDSFRARRRWASAVVGRLKKSVASAAYATIESAPPTM